MKRGRRFVSLLLALVMICSLMVNAGAAESQEEIKAYLNYDITVTYDGNTQTLKDAAGNTVYPVSYNGTTYLPVRAVSNMLGIEVEWDGATRTVILSGPAGGRTAARSDSKASTASGQEEITAYLAPGITVKYNGETQTLKDAAGNIVYPVSYNGTTYLPVRAVSNMLGVAVDWDGATQTVILGESNAETDHGESSNGPADAAEKRDENTITITGTEDEVRAALEEAGLDSSYIDRLLNSIKKTTSGSEITVTVTIGKKKTNNEANEGNKSTSAIKDWAEIDASTANDGYVRVKWSNALVSHARCIVKWTKDGKPESIQYLMNKEQTLGKWVKIPLTAGNQTYTVQFELLYTEEDTDESKTEAELDRIWRDPLTVKFDTDMADENAWTLMSTVNADYEASPNASAKAAELTKNCKTDAEKITAIFKYVAKTIKYDHVRLKNKEKRVAAGESVFIVDSERNLNPDDILKARKGVCEHYAALMTAMLRSVGIPCKMVSGSMKKSDGTTGGHAWVAVKPETGKLDMKALAAGMEPDGEWVRLDPTNVINAPKRTANDDNYETFYYN